MATASPTPWPAPAAPGPLAATAELPGSKSLTNRALVLAALSRTPTRIAGGLLARDTNLMISALAGLGIGVQVGSDWLITPGPLHAADIDCGLAGTVMRFVPAIAALARGESHFDGDPHARTRPMAPLLDALRQAGVAVDGDALPFTVHGSGAVAGGTVTGDFSASSQFISALLLAGAHFDRGIEIIHSGQAVPSLPHIAMTSDALRGAGVQVEDSTPGRWRVSPGELDAPDTVIEPDLSNAAPFLAAALLCGGSVTVPRWPHTTTQAGDELRTLLAQPSLEQLAQRVVARFHLDALSPREAEAYVGHRLAVAGWNGPPPFDRRALKRIHTLTGGVPRRINLLCDRALLGAYAAGVRHVDARTVERAAREVFDTGPAARPRRALGVPMLATLLLAVAAFAVWQNLPKATVARVLPVSEPQAANVLKAGADRPIHAPVADLSSVLPQLPRSEDAALRLLAPAWGVQVPENAAVCATTARQDLPCFRARGAGLDLLRQLDRPAVLGLNLAGKSAYAVLRSLDADSATLEIDGKPQRFAISALAVGWRGDLVTFWRDPDTTAEATDARLARVLPGLPAGLSRNERIARFQVAQGLPPDGLAGPLTAMRLNRASGLDEPRLLHP